MTKYFAPWQHSLRLINSKNINISHAPISDITLRKRSSSEKYYSFYLVYVNYLLMQFYVYFAVRLLIEVTSNRILQEQVRFGKILMHSLYLFSFCQRYTLQAQKNQWEIGAQYIHGTLKRCQQIASLYLNSQNAESLYLWKGIYRGIKVLDRSWLLLPTQGSSLS